MVNVYKGHEFEALKMRFENQTEQLHRMTLIDLRIFSGYILVQTGLAGWLVANAGALPGPFPRVGLMVVDLVVAGIAAALLYNSKRRREEVAHVVRNCSEALGFETEGAYLEGRRLNPPVAFRPWAAWYYVGIVAGVVGVAIVLFGISL